MVDFPKVAATFLVTDLHGFTALSDRHPEAMPAVMARLDSIVRGAIEAHGGRVFKTMGDGFLVVFADASAALAAAVDAQYVWQAESWGDLPLPSHRWREATGGPALRGDLGVPADLKEGGSPLRMTIALHTGTALVHGDDYLGEALNRAILLSGLAHGGQILLSGATAELVQDALPYAEMSLRYLGEERLRGLRRPERIFQVVVPGLPHEFLPLRTPNNRTEQLARSVEDLEALGELGRAISATLDLEQVLTTIIAHAVDLAGADGGNVYEYDERTERFLLRASYRAQGELLDVLHELAPGLGEMVMSRAATERRPIQLDNLISSMQGPNPQAEGERSIRFPALLVVPLLRDGHIVGATVVRRKAPGRFPDETVRLLETLAAQSVIAIENARRFQEIEDRSRALETASRRKSEILANMSHEMRTPLNAIIGFSDVLLERMFGELNDKQEEYLSDILGSGRHLLALINDILDLAKVEAGRMELELTSFSLVHALESGLSMVRERAGRHGITLGLEVDPALDVIEADERKVKQVVFNLLSNAVKFTPDGGLVDVTARLVDGAAQVAVQDTGIGIAPEDQADIFEEFRQARHGPLTSETGTGLGLALTKKLVELHGGRIWVESEPGAGSTFTFTLPLRREEGRGKREEKG